MMTMRHACRLAGWVEVVYSDCKTAPGLTPLATERLGGWEVASFRNFDKGQV